MSTINQTFKEGQIVWVRDSEYHDWAISHFIMLNPDLNYRYLCSNTNDTDRMEGWIYITTENPYEKSED
jgi:hypothetical protein